MDFEPSIGIISDADSDPSSENDFSEEESDEENNKALKVRFSQKTSETAINCVVNKKSTNEKVENIPKRNMEFVTKL